MRRVFLILLLLAFPALSWAESVDYEITSFSDDNVATLLAKGKAEYSAKDLVIEEKNFQGETAWSKSIRLVEGFSIGASVHREPKLTGFGLWAHHEGCRSFSWEWFNLERPGIFRKLQEKGVVTVTYQGLPLIEEIASIHFDTDVSLRINDSCEVEKLTHRVLIKKGSVLSFAASVPSASANANSAKPAPWFVGLWQNTYDEDHSLPDTFEFHPDGTWTLYAPNCNQVSGVFHAPGNDLFIVMEVVGKGSIALVFHPNSSHTKFTYTSPRTRNNATYERVSIAPCQGS